MSQFESRNFSESATAFQKAASSILTDNGAPFAGLGLLGLSKLSPGWMKLGIVHERIQPERIQPERIQPGRPQENGRHERSWRSSYRRAGLPEV